MQIVNNFGASRLSELLADSRVEPVNRLAAVFSLFEASLAQSPPQFGIDHTALLAHVKATEGADVPLVEDKEETRETSNAILFIKDFLFGQNFVLCFFLNHFSFNLTESLTLCLLKD